MFLSSQFCRSEETHFAKSVHKLPTIKSWKNFSSEKKPTYLWLVMCLKILFEITFQEKKCSTKSSNSIIFSGEKCIFCIRQNKTKWWFEFLIINFYKPKTTYLNTISNDCLWLTRKIKVSLHIVEILSYSCPLPILCEPSPSWAST